MNIVSSYDYAAIVFFGDFWLMFNVDAQTEIAYMYAMHTMRCAQFLETVVTGTMFSGMSRELSF